MNNIRSFSDCLAELLKIYNLNGSKLAKGINVDSSLIYKWLRNERVPKYGTPYIDLITNYLVSNINNSFQKKNIMYALNKWSLQKTDLLDINISKIISSTLLEAQGYSIEVLLRKGTGKKSNNIHLNNIDNDTPKLPIKEDLFYGTDNIDIIKGNKEVLYMALDILESLYKSQKPTRDPIIITYNTTMELLPYFKEFNIRWKQALYNLLISGWKIVYLVNLNNKKKNIKLIEDMQFALSTKRYSIYYIKKPDLLIDNEIIIIPKICALYCFSSQFKREIDSAFFFKSDISIEILTNHFSQIFSSAKPLLKPYLAQNSMQFQCMITKTEESLGDRYVFTDDISEITFPIDLYKKYLSLSKKSEKEILKLLSLHKRRINAFKSQIKYYKFKEIWFKESIENLIAEKKYSFNDYYSFDNNFQHKKDIIYHLENVIHMLRTYENYQIAIINKSDYENISKICWVVKENSKVFIEEMNNNMKDTYISNDYSNKIELLISEKQVVSAFQDYFLLLWNNINNLNKEKAEVIKWLQSKINKLNTID